MRSEGLQGFLFFLNATLLFLYIINSCPLLALTYFLKRLGFM